MGSNSLVLTVWAVLKPGFLALLGGPFDTKLLDIIVFDVLPASDGNGEDRVSLAAVVKERNPFRHAFKVIGNFKRGLTEDGSQAQWFVDGRAAFDAIASSIEDAKSEIFMCGWWLSPELYLQLFVSRQPPSLMCCWKPKLSKGFRVMNTFMSVSVEICECGNMPGFAVYYRYPNSQRVTYGQFIKASQIWRDLYVDVFECYILLNMWLPDVVIQLVVESTVLSADPVAQKSDGL
ncbi:Phospholipase D family [Corchorus olitorius]|uniref:Phospholipase D family n=1 Tax=Corchorus olitorius TaxID=93759 RepID=A0A1R3ILI2_9ROSI|nr:Phospholipase D family [Corchorus olitorius]